MASLAEMVLDGVETAGIRFGVGGELVPAAAMLERGRTRFSGSAADGGTVAVLMTNDRPTIELLLGALEAGCRVVSLPIPARSADPAAYLRFVAGACTSQGVTEVVARDDIAALLVGGGVAARSHSELGGRPLASAGSGFELVQFSSGSTSAPKAVLLDDAALGANVAAIIEVVQPTPTDRSVSWLPLSHDMGLIGMLLTSLASSRRGLAERAEFTLLDPVDFLRRPAVWLDALGAGGTITAAPDFAFRLCVERGGIGLGDLSGMRCAIVGGETIRATTLRAFSDRFAVDGFRPETFCPAYGLAEIGLAATISPVGEPWQEVEVDTVALADRRFELGPGGPSGTTVLVSSGRAIPGYEVRCDAADGELGWIEIAGPSHGCDGITGRPFADADGWLRTGDLGAMVDGELVVSGRGDDHIVTASRNLYAPAIEEAVGQVPGVRAGRVVVLGLPSGEWIVAVELAGKEASSAELGRQINRAVVGVASVRPDEVVVVPRGRLPVTPSGKLQRQEAVRRFVAGSW